MHLRRAKPSDMTLSVDTGSVGSLSTSAHQSRDARTAPPHFFTTVYVGAFLLSLGGGFLSGKTSFITINWFAGVDCTSKKDDPTCDHALNVYTAASGITTFASLGVAMLLVPFLTRASDALGRRRFIQVHQCCNICACIYRSTAALYISHSNARLIAAVFHFSTPRLAPSCHAGRSASCCTSSLACHCG